MTMNHFYEELQGISLKYHEVCVLENSGIVVEAVSMDPSGIDEIMQIKQLADTYRLVSSWDGNDLIVTKEVTNG